VRNEDAALLVPCIGFAVIASVLVHMATQAKAVGFTWLMAGVGVLILSRRRGIAPSTGGGSPQGQTAAGREET
jgi:hypothetical protein